MVQLGDRHTVVQDVDDSLVINFEFCSDFEHNCKFANLTQYNMQYIPCNSALLDQEALFLPKKALFMPKDLQKKSA